MNNNVVLKAVGLQKSYKEGGRLLHVLKDVNLEVHEGESVAIVGTSALVKQRSCSASAVWTVLIKV